MSAAYTSTMIITDLALITLAVLVHQNGRITRADKRRFYTAYAVIALAAFWEWLAVFLNGAPAWTRWIHLLSKCLDYTITPICSVMFIRQVSPKTRIMPVIYSLLAGNALLEIASVFTGWTFYLDEANYYHHGPLFPLYLLFAAAAVLFVLYCFRLYGKTYPKQNRGALTAVGVLVLAGILLQECLGSEVRTVYTALTLGSALLFIHYSEFSQIDQDTALNRQKEMLDVDALTGILSRFAFKQAAADLTDAGPLPAGFTAFEIDLNGLKPINDTLGHMAGDDLLRGAASVITESLSDAGKCYRTGGDEFVVFLPAGPLTPEIFVRKLREKGDAWRGTYSSGLSFSVGYACVDAHPDMNITRLVSEADRLMYVDKDRYYSQPGHERRGRIIFPGEN